MVGWNSPQIRPESSKEPALQAGLSKNKHAEACDASYFRTLHKVVKDAFRA